MHHDNDSNDSGSGLSEEEGMPCWRRDASEAQNMITILIENLISCELLTIKIDQRSSVGTLKTRIEHAPGFCTANKKQYHLSYKNKWGPISI